MDKFCIFKFAGTVAELQRWLRQQRQLIRKNERVEEAA